MNGLLLSGWQDSNLRPPAPKAGALTGLRYTPKMGMGVSVGVKIKRFGCVITSRS